MSTTPLSGQKDEESENRAVDSNENVAATVVDDENTKSAIADNDQSLEGVAAPGVFNKICRKCSVQTETGGNFCPNCGAAYIAEKTRRKFSKKTILIAIAAFVLVLGGIVAALMIAESNRTAVAQAAVAEASAEASRSAAAAASQAAAEAEAIAKKESLEKAKRALIASSLEESVLKDAKERETAGTLTGPFSRVSCTPLGGGSIDDLTALTGTFECIAVNKKKDDGSESGYVFSATVNWNAGNYSWRLGR